MRFGDKSRRARRAERRRRASARNRRHHRHRRPSPAIAREAERIGYPLLVKAAGGGGGIGMQVVEDPKKLARARHQACSDRGSLAFGDARVYLERYVASPRTSRFKFSATAKAGRSRSANANAACSAGTRKSSRRALRPHRFSQEKRAKRGASALRCRASRGHHVGYVGAGTVEFIAVPRAICSFSR